MTFVNMSPRAYFILFLFCCLAMPTVAQDFNDRWKGYITLEGAVDTFLYEVNLKGTSANINGTSFCFTKDTSAWARFNLVGVVENGVVIVQEVEQIEPEDGKWCHKYLKMNFSADNNRLTGTWSASNCSPGTVFLEREFQMEEKVVVQEKPFSMEGKWIGHLTQSDRSYGFYVELNLGKNNKGASFIESEGTGGNARMKLVWNGTPANKSFTFVEGDIIKQSVENWRWCIKQGTLNIKKEANKYVMEGPWKGYIEGFDLQTGPCAAGDLILEKPIMSEQIIQTVRRETKKYEATNERKIKVQRIIEVKSSQLRLRTWDSGDVDGDIITIFLNGRQLLNQYRVSKRKYAFKIELSEDNNFLVLHADDIGDISPNTVAVSIDDGEREQMVVLSSDLEESGAILIKKIKL